MQQRQKMFIINSSVLWFLLFMVTINSDLSDAVPKYDDNQKKTASYANPKIEWHRDNLQVNDSHTSQSAPSPTGVGNNDQSNTVDRAERLGFTTGYGSGSGIQGYPYSGTGIGSYGGLKLDIGGVVIGALIGIGAILVIPKFLTAFNSAGGYSSNYRSAIDNDSTGLVEMLSKLDDLLGQNNIDSTSCVQRAVCSYVRSSENHLTMGMADQSDQLIHTVAGNALVEYMLDGTAVKEAIENGKKVQGRDCDDLYPGCQLDRSSVQTILNKIIPNNINNNNNNNNKSNGAGNTQL